MLSATTIQSPRRAFWPWVAIAALATLPFVWVVQRAAIAWSPGAWLSSVQSAEVFAILADRNANPRLLPDDIYLLLALLAATGGYLLMLHHARQVQATKQHLSLLFAVTFLLSSLLWFVPNLLSGDIYSYAIYGRIAALHGGNPFLQTPAEFVDDPFLKWVTWHEVTSIYGPVWIWISAAITWLAERLGGSLGTYVFLYKVLASSAHLAGGVCIVGILGTIAPDRRLFAAAMYLLNPLALFEFAMNGHNDAVMLLGVLLGICFSLRVGSRAEFWSALAFCAAFLTKWTAGAALMVFGLRAIVARDSWRARLRSGGIFAVAGLIVALTYLPFWQGTKTFDPFRNAPPVRRTANSLADFALRQAFESIHRAHQATALSEAEAGQLIALHNKLWFVANAAVALALLIGLIWVARNRIDAHEAVGWVLLVHCATALWFWPWYATWPLALGALSAWRGLGRIALAFSLCAPLTYVLRATPYIGLFAIGLPVLWLTFDRQCWPRPRGARANRQRG